MTGFFIHTVEGGYVMPFETLAAKAEALEVGQAMIYNGEYAGAFTALAEHPPTHISMCRRTADSSALTVSVVRTSPAVIFEVESEEELAENAEFAVSDDGMSIKAVESVYVSCGTIIKREELTDGTFRYHVRFK